MQRPGKTISISGRAPLPSFLYEKIKNAILGQTYDLSLSFVSPSVAKRLNKAYRNKSYVPNTLSFSLSKRSGEIIICRIAARREYRKFSLSYKNYVLFLFIHSLLHLKGMRHGGTMERMEQKLLKRFLINAK